MLAHGQNHSSPGPGLDIFSMAQALGWKPVRRHY